VGKLFCTLILRNPSHYIALGIFYLKNGNVGWWVQDIVSYRGVNVVNVSGVTFVGVYQIDEFYAFDRLHSLNLVQFGSNLAYNYGGVKVHVFRLEQFYQPFRAFQKDFVAVFVGVGYDFILYPKVNHIRILYIYRVGQKSVLAQILP
jgi:hypothetical protein